MIGRGRRVLVVEDEALTSGLLVEALRGQGFDVDAASSAKQALEIVDPFDPDLALLDIDLGDGPNGVDLGFILHRTRAHISLVFLTKHPDGRSSGAEEADLPPGAAFLSKDRVRDANYLATAIDVALHDRPEDVRHDLEPSRPLAELSDRQLEILRLIARGFTNERIMEETGLSRSSVERWAREVFDRLGIDTAGELNPRVEATRRYIAAAGLPAR